MKNSSKKLSILRRRRAAYTLAELIIGMSVSSLTMVAVSGLMLVGGRTIKNVYGETSSRSARMRVFEQIRYRLSDGEIGSVELSDPINGDEFKTMKFLDPNQAAGQKSRFHFELTSGTLYYDQNIGNGSFDEIPVASGVDEVTFQDVDQAGAMILITVRTNASLAMGSSDPETAEMVIYLKNTP